MPTVTFNATRDAQYENFICFSGSCVGPNTGNYSITKAAGSTNGYSAITNGPGGIAYRIDSSTQIGLDDAQGVNADNDYNDLVVRITSGNAEFRGGGLYVYYDPPVISQFFASPNPQTSSNGIRNYSTTLFWSVSNATSLTLISSAGESWNVSGTTFRSITNLPQSTAGSNSPARRTYTLIASNPDRPATSASIQVAVYNDNTPSSLTTNGQAVAPGGSKPFTALEPNTTYYTRVFIAGVDMPVIASPAGAGISVGTNTSNWTSGNKLVRLSQPLYVRWTSMPFNTSTTPGGTNGDGLVVGQTNSKTITCSVGSRSISFTATTRAPVIEEVFNLEGINTNNNSPFPDIDTISDTPTPSAFQYAQTGEITANDIEIDNEIKTDSPDAQVQINNTGVWRDMRQI